MPKQQADDEDEEERVDIALPPETLMDILRHAASKERVVIEFRVEDGVLDKAFPITEHVETMEEELDYPEPEPGE